MYTKDVRDEITALIEATWPDLTALFRGASAARMNWRALIDMADNSEPNGLVPPWGVLETGPSLAASYGDANDAYETQISVYYVTRLADPGGARKSDTAVENELIDAHNAMRAALLADGANWQVTECTLESGSNCDANVFFLKKNYPFLACVVRAKLITGLRL